MDPISKGFIAAIHAFAHAHEVPLLRFEKGQRKDSVTRISASQAPVRLDMTAGRRHPGSRVG